MLARLTLQSRRVRRFLPWCLARHRHSVGDLHPPLVAGDHNTGICPHGIAPFEPASSPERQCSCTPDCKSACGSQAAQSWSAADSHSPHDCRFSPCPVSLRVAFALPCVRPVRAWAVLAHRTPTADGCGFAGGWTIGSPVDSCLSCRTLLLILRSSSSFSSWVSLWSWSTLFLSAPRSRSLFSNSRLRDMASRRTSTGVTLKPAMTSASVVGTERVRPK